MKLTSWALLILLSFIWGGSFFFNKIALMELRPFTVLVGRTLFGAIALHLFLVARGRPLIAGFGLWKAFLLLGILNNVIPFSLILWAQTHINSGLASVMNATTPLWTVMVAHMLTRDEKLRKGKFVGVLLGFFGVAVMVGADAAQGRGFDGLAQTAVVVASLSYAFGAVFAKRLKAVPSLHIAAGQLTCSSLLMLPVAFWFDSIWLLPSLQMQTWGAVFGLSILCSAFAYMIFFYILKTEGATSITLVTFLIPVSASALGFIFFGETYSSDDFIGIALIASGLAMIDGRLTRWIGRLQPFQNSRRNK